MPKEKENFEDSPLTAMEALKLWDKEEILWSIEMGGIGPSYEQSIQFSVFELIRELKGVAPSGNENTINKKLDESLAKIDKKFDIGHSGATAGASKNLAYKYMKFGYRKTLQNAPESRIIQIDNTFGRFILKRKI